MQDFVDELVLVFAEVRRLLRPDGTMWLNMGDGYVTNSGGMNETHTGLAGARRNEGFPNMQKRVAGLKFKDMLGMPWRIALALQAAGWYLRSDIVWEKPQCMPESVKDRPTKSHEYVFLMTKSESYWYDADAIKEPTTGTAHPRHRNTQPHHKAQQADQKRVRGNARFAMAIADTVEERNKRSVWHGARDFTAAEQAIALAKRYMSDADYDAYLLALLNKPSVWSVPQEKYGEAHYATFPQELVKPMVLAGCPEGGIVLDPFAGSGTTLLVAKELGRKAVGIELNADYCDMAVRRLKQDVLPLVNVAVRQ